MAQDLSHAIAGHIIAFLPNSAWTIEPVYAAVKNLPLFKTKTNAIAYATQLAEKECEVLNRNSLNYCRMEHQDLTFSVLSNNNYCLFQIKVVEKQLS